ncbi:ATP-dependent endonuclease [Desulfonema ishimotonii]|uniref:ATP-dependent endonuclease n=1 Tax=Desulfonema ishimotonii TaxID=45657 RepID=A0A401FXM3_9BACT|nr:ATP-dependent endonuclease [Desulfonema ishimotonii]
MAILILMKKKKYMIWYSYLFLNRGKPSTHILALSGIDDAELWKKLPPSLKRLVERVMSVLESDPCSQVNSLGGQCVETR